MWVLFDGGEGGWVLFREISWFYAVDAVFHIGDGEMIPRGVSRGWVMIMGDPPGMVLWGIET